MFSSLKFIKNKKPMRATCIFLMAIAAALPVQL